MYKVYGEPSKAYKEEEEACPTCNYLGINNIKIISKVLQPTPHRGLQTQL